MRRTGLKQLATDSTKFYVEEATLDNSLLIARGADGKLTVSIDNPWYGDSVGGFGVELELELEADQVAALVRWLTGKTQ